ncbi:hypothetical protein D7Y52_04295 [Stenotrophomonas maltophilia]|nr:hypothetical protein [Stenotrophomonas maltophilia]MBA0293083.1 hypothetical protein [Stenotrophomonas maltophilia]MBA0348079.1 hypothetical protein [Stenotrophomonas maltophilia]PJL49372.1 hypothetical protein B9Y73_16650 [Stenotrophomonas maltophilia]PJL52613.1 hypothetical protein B9Y60_16650 [Stenotrophomonas maltophilia]
MIPAAAKIRFLVSGYMDFQPTAQPLVAGGAGGGVWLLAESQARSRAWPGGWDCAGDAASTSM